MAFFLSFFLFLYFTSYEICVLKSIIYVTSFFITALMGPEIDEEGNIVNALRVDWSTGGAFVTPPGWWHSHHNESSEDAWVLPIQDAGLYTHQRTLDIRFVDEEIELARAKKRRGATFKGSDVDLKSLDG
jgi:hypothetical protein